MKAVLPAIARPLIEPRLPAELDIDWFATREDAVAMIADADIAWIDMHQTGLIREAVSAARQLKWLNTVLAGVDFLDLAALKASGTLLTNGTGINAVAVAEYTVLGMLAAAKRYDEVVRLADQRAWTTDAPGKLELDESSALIIGMGTIGNLVADRLKAFGVAVTGVTRSGRDGTLTPDQWRDRLGEFDWIILAAPATASTRAMIGEGELRAMRSSAWLVNMARGEMIDQDALADALHKRRIAGAFLDTVTPEPLPAEHPLWRAPNALFSLHLSGRSQTRMFQRGTDMFLSNLEAFLAGKRMRNLVDLDAGY